MVKSVKRPATRADVAQAAGVSLTTVTHALNPPPGARVKPETAAHVKRVAAELGYRPSFTGRALVSGKTYAVGLLQPTPRSVSVQLYQDIAIGMMEAMEDDDYHLMMFNCSDDYRYLNSINQGRVDGMFVVNSNLVNEHVDQVVQSGIPTVIVNKHYAPQPNTPVGCACHDHHSMMRDAVNELVNAGCRNLLLVIDPRWIDANAQIHRHYISAVGDHADKGVFGSVMTPPEEDRFTGQIRNALASGQRWDGIITDRLTDAEDLLAESDAIGLEVGRDYQLITTDTVHGGATASRRERSAYTQTPQQVGKAAWGLMKRLLDGDTSEQTVQLPYQRFDIAIQA